MQHYISDSIYGLTLALITSENSTKQLECRHLDSIFFAGPYLLPTGLSARVSTVDRLCLCPVANSQLRAPFFNSLLASPSTSGHGENSSPKPFVWFRAKTDKGIVCLAGHLHSVTVAEKRNHKRKTEFLLITAQNKTIRTNYIKARIDKTRQNSNCRLYSDRDEIINHIISECCKLAQKSTRLDMSE